MSSFSGKITTTGKSEAIRLEKALFRAHPEFRQRASVRASVIAPGQLLVSLVGDDLVADDWTDDDPVVGAFIGFLAEGLKRHPERVAPLSASRVRAGRRADRGYAGRGRRADRGGYRLVSSPFDQRNGWKLYLHPAFRAPFDRLTDEVERLRAADPADFQRHPKAKLLRRIMDLVLDEGSQ